MKAYICNENGITGNVEIIRSCYKIGIRRQF